MKLIKLKNEKLEVTLCDLGASIFRIRFDNQDMVLSPIREDDFLKEDVYYGKTIGRICGRVIRDNQIILHGGHHGLSNQIFDYVVEDNKVILK